MGRKREVIHLTVEEYMAAKERESTPSNVPFRYNTITNTLKLDMAKLKMLVKAGENSKRILKDSDSVFSADFLN